MESVDYGLGWDRWQPHWVNIDHSGWKSSPTSSESGSSLMVVVPGCLSLRLLVSLSQHLVFVHEGERSQKAGHIWVHYIQLPNSWTLIVWILIPCYHCTGGDKFNKIFERCKWIFKMSGGEIPLARKPLLQKCQQKTHFIKASLLQLTSPVSTVLLFINTRIQKDARNLENRGLHQSFFSIHVLVCIAAL